uniref:Uncharacterized protein n=1 Tax=Anguilla anguilla TaxID=7936 RepID=A0A0E9XH94_ANGAN
MASLCLARPNIRVKCTDPQQSFTGPRWGTESEREFPSSPFFVCLSVALCTLVQCVCVCVGVCKSVCVCVHVLSKLCNYIIIFLYRACFQINMIY